MLTNNKLYSIDVNMWKSCRVCQYDFLFTNVSRHLKHLTNSSNWLYNYVQRNFFFQLLPTNISSLTMLAEYIQEDSKGDDDEDVTLSLSSARVIEWEAGCSVLLSSHQTVGNGSILLRRMG